MLDDALWEEGERIFIYSYQSSGMSRYMFLMLAPSKMCPLCADRAVPKKFGGIHVSGARGEFKRIIDQVNTNRDANLVRIFFLWMMINDSSTICDCTVGRDEPNLFGRKETDCVIPLVMPGLPCAN
jgi:hypothetical protein